MAEQSRIHLQGSLEVKKDVEHVWISNLYHATPRQEIVDFFEKFVGPVECFTMHYNSKGYYACQAAIFFCKPDDARKALFYDGVLLSGRQIHLKLFVNNKRVFKDQIVIPGPVVSTVLPVSPENVPSQEFQTDRNSHESTSEEKIMQIQPQERAMTFESSEVTQDFPPEFTQQSNSVNEEYLLVSNLRYSVTGQQILDHFQKMVGPVQSVGIYLDDKGFLNGKAKIIFRRPDDARKALSLGTQELDNRRMVLKHFVNGKLNRVNRVFHPNTTTFHPSDDWISSVPLVSLPSLNSFAEYFPGDPILDTTFTVPSKLDAGIAHPQGQGIPPFLPLVIVKDCIRPYKPPVSGLN